MTSYKNIIGLVAIFVSLTTSVLGNTPASTICGDPSGFACMYKSNHLELQDVPVRFDNPLPSWLTGMLVRNGLGQFEREKQSVTHVFDGFAKLSSWRFFPNGTTVFSTRFIRSGFYTESMARDHFAPYLFFNAPKPPFDMAERAESIINGIDNMNVNIWHFPTSQGDPGFVALSDYWNVYDISGRDLATNGLVKPDLQGVDSFGHMNLMSAGHPLPEPGTSNRITFLVGQRMMTSMKNQLSIVRMSSVTGRSVIAEWDVDDDVPYMHSFGVTQTKVVLITGPIVADASGKCIVEHGCALPCMKWIDGKPSVMYIADLKSGEKKIINMTDTLFAIHHINAYDVGDDGIVMDVVSYDNSEVLTKIAMMDVMLNETKRNAAYFPSVIRRVTVNTTSNAYNIQDLSTKSRIPDSYDMPAINENYRSRKYCYSYGLSTFADGKRYVSSAIIKKDMCNGGAVVGKLMIDNHYPVEPSFAPNPAGKTEDDGVLLVPFLRGPDAVTYLAVVDAKTMNITTKADTPTYLPFSLHGRFVPDFY